MPHISRIAGQKNIVIKGSDVQKKSRVKKLDWPTLPNQSSAAPRALAN
jgi:hypothetical protein